MWAPVAAALVAVACGAGPVASLASLWTTVDTWWRLWCAATCGLWTLSAGVALVAASDTELDGCSVAVAAVASGAIAVTLAVIDLREYRLPHPLTATAAVVAIAAAAGCGDVRAALAGAGAAYAIHLTVRLACPLALGAGDVQLAAPVGAVGGAVGPAAWWASFVVAAAVGALLGWRGSRPRTGANDGRQDRGVPHGPGLCIGALLAPVFG